MPPPSPPSFLDQLFDISSLVLPEITIQCDHHTSYDVVPSSNASKSSIDLSSKGLIAASMRPIDLFYPSTTSFPVIFDSGASLAISFAKSNFVGPIRPLEGQSLGGLANGLSIAGIGTVHWKFRTKDSILTVASSAYYVPGAVARLISPQRLFNAERGVTGYFKVEEHNSTLVFDNVGEIKIEYDSRSHLPVVMGTNKTPGDSEVNLAGVLRDAYLLTP